MCRFAKYRRSFDTTILDYNYWQSELFRVRQHFCRRNTAFQETDRVQLVVSNVTVSSLKIQMYPINDLRDCCILQTESYVGVICFLWSAPVMMTSSNGNLFRSTGPLCEEFTSHRWIPCTKASDAEIWCFSLICTWLNGWVNNSEAGDLRCHRANYDVTVMVLDCRFMVSFTWDYYTLHSSLRFYNRPHNIWSG